MAQSDNIERPYGWIRAFTPQGQNIDSRSIDRVTQINAEHLGDTVIDERQRDGFHLRSGKRYPYIMRSHVAVVTAPAL